VALAPSAPSGVHPWTMSRHIALESTPTATSGQLVTAVTARRLGRRSTRHNTVAQPPILGCDELTVPCDELTGSPMV